MKNAILMTIVCILACASALAQNGIQGTATYSETFKSNLASKLESDTAYRKKYFSIAYELLRSETAISRALADLNAKIKSVEASLAGAGSNKPALEQERSGLLKDKADVLKYHEETVAPSRVKVPDPDLLVLSAPVRNEWKEYKRNPPPTR